MKVYIHAQLTETRLYSTAIYSLCKRYPIKTLHHTYLLIYLRLECISEKWVYQNITLLEYLPHLISTFHSRELHAVCDGSIDKGYGTPAWCIHGNGSIIRGLNIVPLGSDTLDPTRCEIDVI